MFSVAGDATTGNRHEAPDPHGDGATTATGIVGISNSGGTLSWPRSLDRIREILVAKLVTLICKGI